MEVRQVANVLELMEWFSQRRASATMSEIADALGWPRSSTFNLIGTLSRRGYLYEPRIRGSYFPTSRWLDVAQSISAADPLPMVFEEQAQKLRDECGETVAISAPAGTGAIYLFVAQSTALVRYSTFIGYRVPIHATSSGRALLAQYSPAERNVLYSKISFIQYSKASPLSSAQVEDRLLSEMARGFHVSNEEHSPDLTGIAVPLALGGRRLALTIGGPRDRCLPRVQALAEMLFKAKANCTM